MRYRRALPVQALQRRVDAREPDARCAKGSAPQCSGKKKRYGPGSSERRTRRYGPAGDWVDVTPRCVAAAGNGRLELCRFGQRLVVVAKKPGKPEAARHDGK